MNNPPPQVTEDNSTWDKLKGWTSQHLDVRPQLTALKQAAEKATAHAINLMVIFLLQTLVLPLLLVWILWGFVKGVVVLPAQVPQLTRSG